MLKAKFDCSSTGMWRTNSWRMGRVFLSAFVVFLALALSIRNVSAHGIGFYLIRGAVVGSYTVHVWNAPAILRTGNIHLDAAVFDATGEPALSTVVQVRVIPLEWDGPLSIMTSPPAEIFPHLRGASFPLNTPGNYRLEIEVVDAKGSVGTTTADVQVKTIDWQMQLAFAVFTTVPGSIGFWLLYQTTRWWIKGAPTRRASA